jgi:hypothetical protein
MTSNHQRWTMVYMEIFSRSAFPNRSRSSVFACTLREIHFHPDSHPLKFNALMFVMAGKHRPPVVKDWVTFATPSLSEITHIFFPPVGYIHLNRFAERLPHLTHIAVNQLRRFFGPPSVTAYSSLAMLVLAIAKDIDTTLASRSAGRWVRESRQHTSKVFPSPEPIYMR